MQQLRIRTIGLIRSTSLSDSFHRGFTSLWMIHSLFIGWEQLLVSGMRSQLGLLNVIEMFLQSQASEIAVKWCASVLNSRYSRLQYALVLQDSLWYMFSMPCPSQSAYINLLAAIYPVERLFIYTSSWDEQKQCAPLDHVCYNIWHCRVRACSVGWYGLLIPLTTQRYTVHLHHA